MRQDGASRSSWKNEAMPAARRQLGVERMYSREEYAVIARGCTPEEMEDKWFIFLEGDRLYFCRSWTGFCIYEVQFTERDDGRYVIAEAWVNRNPDQYEATDDGHDAALLLYLLDYLLLGYNVPFPERSDLGGEGNALYAWSEVGRGRERTDWENHPPVTVSPRTGHPIISCYGATAEGDYDLILIIGREPNCDQVIINEVGPYDFKPASHCGFWVSSYALAARSAGLAPPVFKDHCRKVNGSPILYADAMPQGLLHSDPHKRRKREAISEAAIRLHVANMFEHSILRRVRLVILSGIQGPVYATSRECIAAECSRRGIRITNLPFFSNQNAKRIENDLEPESRSLIAVIASEFLAMGGRSRSQPTSAHFATSRSTSVRSDAARSPGDSTT